MSLTTIESLNEDVFLNIFDFLDGSSLKQCAKVCRNWDEIIGSSASTMRKLPLALRYDWDTKMDEVGSLRRMHYHIIVDSTKTAHSNFLELLQLSTFYEELCASVRVLEVHRDDIVLNSLSKIIDSMSLLEKVVLCGCLVAGDVYELKKKSLTNLKSLILIKSDLNILEFFTQSETQVQELKIVAREFDTDMESFKGFINIQRNLRKLAIRTQDKDTFEALANIKSKFKLKDLSIDFKNWQTPADDNFIKFLQTQQSTLQNLEMEFSNDKVVEFVMKKLTLNRLIINGQKLPDRLLFYNAIRPNNHLTTLVLEGEMKSVDTVQGLLHIYSFVEKLIIKNWKEEITNEVIIFIANNLKHLNHLEIPSLSKNTPELAIPSLKTLHVDFVDDIDQWRVILMNNPTLETVSVKWVPVGMQLTYEVLSAISLRLPNLRHMIIGAGFKPTQRILATMHRNCPRLQLLEIFKNDLETDSELNVNTNIGNFKVIFYPHEAVMSVFKTVPKIWNSEKYFDLNFDSDDELSDDENDMMSWEDDESDHENDFDEVDEDAFPDDDGHNLMQFHIL